MKSDKIVTIGKIFLSRSCLVSLQFSFNIYLWISLISRMVGSQVVPKLSSIGVQIVFHNEQFTGFSFVVSDSHVVEWKALCWSPFRKISSIRCRISTNNKNIRNLTLSDSSHKLAQYKQTRPKASLSASKPFCPPLLELS